ncbi:M23 family metallopeptidase [Isoalcanivorax indicus]|uniref:M23 family metallopeptidase n=1 Tax=Isoalcanivorax indicus TaxID=2202653 RepID=UPI000DB91374|nr:M23 family metallopeptidase [Isoalcanivorax indicus]
MKSTRLPALSLLLLAWLLSPAQASEAPGGLLKALRGEPAPGALLIGETIPGTEVRLDGRRLTVTGDGYFVFGFGRDDEGPASLHLRRNDDSSTYEITLAARQWDIQRIEGVPQRTVTPPAEALARISREAGQVTAARNTDSTLTGFREDFIWPVRGRITGVYGSQRIFNGEPRRPHYGVDIAAPTGTPIQAPASGQVTLVHDDMFYSGGTLIIDHGLGVSSTYLHMSEILVAEGDVVAQGDIIGKVGATGRATGPHLCWRLNWYQERLDPRSLTGDM